jgi:hypothetical protein
MFYNMHRHYGKNIRQTRARLQISLQVVLTLYISSGADSKKVFNGIDSCGNICGINNTKRMTRKANCKPEDHRDYP